MSIFIKSLQSLILFVAASIITQSFAEDIELSNDNTSVFTAWNTFNSYKIRFEFIQSTPSPSVCIQYESLEEDMYFEECDYGTESELPLNILVPIAYKCDTDEMELYKINIPTTKTNAESYSISEDLYFMVANGSFLKIDISKYPSFEKSCQQ